MRTRIRMAITAAALACASALFIATPGAIGVNGDFVRAGDNTTATFPTTLIRTDYFSQSDCNVNTIYFGLVACSRNAVWGKGTLLGVQGSAGENGTGVYGAHNGLHGIGVKGQTNGTGSGVYGLATGQGVGVYGESPNNTGVIGVGTNGVQGSASAGGTGVYGQNSGSFGIGVWGKTGGTGSAVYGQATANGVGVNGVSASGTAVRGAGGFTGVFGSGTDYGVEGSASAGGIGVYGHNSGSSGAGVKGQTGGGGSAVYGYATANGFGVYGWSQFGAGLLGESPNGTALEVNGKAKFSRSGIVTIAAGTASKTVSLGGVTTSSMVIGTAQQNGNVFVKAALPSGGSFKLFLTGNAPVGGLKVAYFVLN
jgi:hypothetical protein